MISTSESRIVALDHNFPEPILQALVQLNLFPGIEFHWIRDLGDQLGPGDDGRYLSDLDDGELIYELHRIGLTVLLTDDYKMGKDVATLTAIEQTRMTVMAIESAGHDPVLATGVLLRDLMPVLKRPLPRGVIFKPRPSQVRPERSIKLIEALVDDASAAMREHGLPYSERQKYPDDHPKRLFPGFRRR